MEIGKDYEILKTNLQPFFWRKVKNVIRQNKKAALHEFLLGSNQFINQDNRSAAEDSSPGVKILEDQVHSLQQKIIQLEQNQTLQIKNTISQLLKASRDNKTIQQDDSTLKTESSLQSPDLISNDTKANSDSEIKNKKTKHPIPESLSEDSKIHFKDSETSKQYNLPLNQEKGLNEHNFITLKTIPEQERIQIIQTGFQRQAQGIISLKKYYQSTDPYSLFQLKGYNIKYESIRRTKLYQQLKR